MEELLGVALHFVDGDAQSEVVEKQELEFQLVEFGLRESPNFGVARIGVKNIGEEFRGDGNTGDEEPVDVVTVNCKGAEVGGGGGAAGGRGGGGAFWVGEGGRHSAASLDIRSK